MKKNIIMILVVVALIIGIIGSIFYISNKTVAKKTSNVKLHNKIKFIIDNQINEAVNFAENQIKIDLVESLANNECSLIAIDKRSSSVQSKYANLTVTGTPTTTHLENPYANSGCSVIITYGQGTVNSYANDIKDKVLYLNFTNGGNFIIIKNKTTLEKKYWPRYTIKQEI